MKDAFDHPFTSQQSLFIAVKKLLHEDDSYVCVARDGQQTLPWPILQVIKTIFEGQARTKTPVQMLYDMFKPVYSALNTASLYEELK